MNAVWQALVDVLFGGALLGIFMWQMKFLKDRIRILEQGQQTLQAEATTLKTHTDRLLAVLLDLSPEKFVQRVKATEELLEKHADAQVKEVQREWIERFNVAVAEKETQEQQIKRLSKQVEDYAAMWSKAAAVLAVLASALYEMPRFRREAIIKLLRDDTQRAIVNELIAELEKKLGPSPADRSPFAEVLIRALSSPAQKAGREPLSPV